MSLRPDPIGPVPADTARAVHAAFRKGKLYVRIREEVGTIYKDDVFADLFSHTGQPAEAPWRLALVCVLQYLEDLSDRQAADAVRARMDWKYLLGLELTDPGFDASILTEFRARLVAHEAGERIFDRLVERLSERGWLKKRGVQRTDSTHVLAAVRRLNRLELLGETVRAALNALAEADPEWLKEWMEQIGQDGSRLQSEVWAEQAPAQLRQTPEIEGLRKTWVQQFMWQEERIRLRNKDNLPPAHVTQRSPYDPEAHYGHKRDLSWFGYKVHLSEACAEEWPHLITHVVTTDATKTDVEQTETIHQALAERDLLPTTHLVDAGYVDAELVLQSRDRYGIELVGPISQNNQWQAKAGTGYDLACFTFDWQAK